MTRFAKVIDKADELGMVVILGFYYFGQDQRVKDEPAVIASVDAATDWIITKQYKNVLVEVNNECDVNICSLISLVFQQVLSLFATPF